MKFRFKAIVVCTALAAATAAGAAAVAGASAPTASPVEGAVYPLYPEGVPGGAVAARPEVDHGRRVRDVAVPTLILFFPNPAKATRTAVIIAPGGGFEHLSIANEGTALARRLADEGITAIVLKYRLNPSRAPGAPPSTRPAGEVNASPGAVMAMADGEAAVRFVRAHASAWRIAPDRVGVLGFSAGGVVALHLALCADPACRPDFVAAIYAPTPPGASVPSNPPPLFLAVAADDHLVGPPGVVPVFDMWRAAGANAELHVFNAGGHGFGMAQQHRTSDHWIDDYLWWLDALGFSRAKD